MAASNRKGKKRAALLRGQSEASDWSTFTGGLDEGTPGWKMAFDKGSEVENVVMDDRPGVLRKRDGLIQDSIGPFGFVTENLHSFIKSDGTETLLRSFRKAADDTETRIDKRNADGTWSELFYTGAGALGTVATNNVWTETSAHNHNFTHWIKVGDELATSDASSTFKPITSVTSTTITCSAGGLTDGAGQSFTVRKELGSNKFVVFITYKDHAWWVSGTSNFLMAYNGTDIFENPNNWSSGAPARDTTKTDCPKGDTIAIWNERMLIGAIADTLGDGDSLIHYSPVAYEPANDPDGIIWNGLNEEPIFINDGQVIRWLRVAHERLYVFKDKELYFLDGKTPDDWRLRRVNNGRGTRFGRLVNQIPSGPFAGALFWLGDDDFYAFNPSMESPQKLANVSLNTTLKTINRSIWNANSSSWTTDTNFNAVGTSKTNVTVSTGTGNDGSVKMALGSDVTTTEAEFEAAGFTPSNVNTDKVSGKVIIAHHASTFYIDNQTTADSDAKINDSVSHLAQVFTSAKSYNLIRPTVRMQLKKVGSPTGTLRCHIYLTSAGKPLNAGTASETSSQTIDISTLETSFATSDFHFTGTIGVGATLAIVLDTTGASLTSSNYVVWAKGGNGINGTRFEWNGSNWVNKNNDHDLRMFEYLTTGTIQIESGDIDTAITTPVFGNLEASSTLNGQTITYATKTHATDATLEPDTSYVDVVPGAAIGGTALRHIMWRATLATTLGGATPELEDVTLNWAPSSSIWTSENRDAGSNVNNWGSYATTEDAGAGVITHLIIFAASSAALDTAKGDWAANGLTVTPGLSLAALSTVPAITDQWFAVRTTFTTSDATGDIPELFDTGISWQEGNVPKKLPSSHIFRDNIYLSFLEDGDTNPKTHFRYDSNGAWIKDTYGDTVEVVAWTTFQNNLYVADNTRFIQYISRVPTTFSDRGTAVTGKFTSPDLDMGFRDQLKFFRKFVVSCEKQSMGGNLTIGYALDADIDAGTFSTVTIDQSGTTGDEINEPIPFPFATVGKRIAYQVAQSGLDETFGLTKITTHFDVLPDVESAA